MNDFKALAISSCLGFELPNPRFSMLGSFHCERQGKHLNVLGFGKQAKKSSNPTTIKLLRKKATKSAKSCSEKDPLLMRRSHGKRRITELVLGPQGSRSWLSVNPSKRQKLKKVWCPTRSWNGKGGKKKKEIVGSDWKYAWKKKPARALKSNPWRRMFAHPYLSSVKNEVEKLQFGLINNGSCCCGWGRGPRVHLSGSLISTTLKQPQTTLLFSGRRIFILYMFRKSFPNTDLFIATAPTHGPQ